MEITLRDIRKYYGLVRANEGISMTVRPGTVHGILGENGAGKSTLMKVLSGYTPRTGGDILADGRPVDFRAPEDAARLGIGMLYQDPLDFPRLTVLENFMLGQSRGLFLSRARYRARLRELCDYLGFSLVPEAPVRRLTVGERQQLEILRLIALGTRVLILDEPTTGISSDQKEALFRALKTLTAEGKSVLLVSHKLEDVELLCDRITVLRGGQMTGEMDAPFDTRAVLSMMFGAPPGIPPRSRVTPGRPVLAFRNVSAPGGRTGLISCDVTIHAGERVGLAGLEGSGQGVFLRVAAGLTRPGQGTVTLNEMPMTGRDYHAFRRKGVCFLPTDRLAEGLVPGLTITEHFALRDRRHPFLVKWTAAFLKAQDRIRDFRVKGTPDARVEALSGGNQQRLLLSFLPRNPSLLLLENPTRGLDLASAHWVWEHLQGYGGHDPEMAIIFSSPELDEILMAADRVLVFFDGRIVRDVRTDETGVAELGRAIAGDTGSIRHAFPGHRRPVI